MRSARRTDSVKFRVTGGFGCVCPAVQCGVLRFCRVIVSFVCVFVLKFSASKVLHRWDCPCIWRGARPEAFFGAFDSRVSLHR